jgi:hypothetical protein
MNAYQQFLTGRTNQNNLVSMNKQFEQQAPKIVSSYGQRGLVGPGVQSGAFKRAMADFAKNRIDETAKAQQSISEQGYMNDYQSKQLNDQYQNDLADMEAEKARQIESDAQELMRIRAGA